MYGFDNSGKVSDIIYLSAKNTDWEDLAKDESGNIYIGDFGNDRHNRRDLKILKIPDPSAIQDNIVIPEVILFSYSDQKRFPPSPEGQNFDMEAMICLNGNIYLFSKNRTEPFTGYTKVYRLPSKPGTYVAELIDSVYLGPAPMINNWVTAADISPDKTKLVLLSSDKLWIFSCFEGDKFFSGEKQTIEFTTFSQKEAVCFKNDNELLITDEITYKVMGGRLYSLDLRKVKVPSCN